MSEATDVKSLPGFQTMAGASPYDVNTWGAECGRGVRYQNLGTVTDGQKGAVRKLSSGRKAFRGSSSGDLERRDVLKQST